MWALWHHGSGVHCLAEHGHAVTGPASGLADPSRSEPTTGEAGTGLGGEPMAPIDHDRLWTVAEVADHMRVSNMTVYRLIKSGELPAIRVGKNYRIRGRELAAFLDASSTLPHDR